jgi:hypothetical protein
MGGGVEEGLEEKLGGERDDKGDGDGDGDGDDGGKKGAKKKEKKTAKKKSAASPGSDGRRDQEQAWDDAWGNMRRLGAVIKYKCKAVLMVGGRKASDVHASEEVYVRERPGEGWRGRGAPEPLDILRVVPVRMWCCISKVSEEATTACSVCCGCGIRVVGQGVLYLSM